MYCDENEGDGELSNCGGYTFSISKTTGKVIFVLIGSEIIPREQFGGVLETRARELESAWKNRGIPKKS